MIRKGLFLCIMGIFLFSSVGIAADRIFTADKNRDGKIDTWTNTDADGHWVVIASDRHLDGKPDTWIYFDKSGSIYKREWDRNFDGKPDLRTLEDHHHLIEKHYDDNFDGKFELIQKAPPKGSSGRIKTTP